MRISDWSSDVCSSDLDRTEEILRFACQLGVDVGRAVGYRAVFRFLAVEDAQRVLVEPCEAVFAQVSAMRLEMLDERRAPCVAALRVAQRIERQCDTLADAQFLQKLVGEHEQFGIGQRAVAAEHFGVELVELAIAALLRSEEHTSDLQ